MLISIIVPVYNVKDYLLKCLNSIDKQTFEDYEVIIIDDGSTDGSCEIIDEYCSSHSKFKAHHKDNGGVMTAWIYGLKLASGDYIGFVDSDDYIAPTMYEELADKVIKYGVDISFCNHYYQINNKLSIHINPINEGLYTANNLASIKKKIFPKIGNYASPSRCNKLIKKSILLNNLHYCDTIITSGDDVNIIVPCMLSCESMFYIDSPLYYYVRRATSLSHVFKPHILETYLILINNLRKAAENSNMALSSEVENLYNIYGVNWCKYVANSVLPINEKIKKIRNLFTYNHFSTAIKMINRNMGTTSYFYKLTIKLKFPPVFLFFNFVFNFIIRHKK